MCLYINIPLNTQMHHYITTKNIHNNLGTPAPYSDSRAAIQTHVLLPLSGKKNFVQMKGAFEDTNHVYIVFEHWGGGDLLDSVTSATIYTERHASVVFKQMMGWVEEMHALGVTHR